MVGVARITMDFYGNDRSSKKHKLIEELCKDIRKKYNISALEVGEFDDPEKCVLGFAAIIPETWSTETASTFVQKICQTIDETAFARVTSEDWDLLEHGTPQGT